MLVTSSWLYDISSCRYVNCHSLGPGAAGHWPLSPHYDGCDNVTFVNYDQSVRSRHRSIVQLLLSGPWRMMCKDPDLVWGWPPLAAHLWQLAMWWPLAPGLTTTWVLSLVKAGEGLNISYHQQWAMLYNVIIVLRHFDIFDLMKSTDE